MMCARILRMRFLILILATLLNPLTTSEITAEEFELDIEQLIELNLDPVYIEEFQMLNNAAEKLISLVNYQDQQQVKIEDTVIEYYETDMTNEALWKVLDSIYSQTDSYVDQYDLLIRKINPFSRSKNRLANSIYAESLDLLNELNSYSIENNKLTKGMIDHLRNGDIDGYNFLAARAKLGNADLVETFAKRAILNAKRLPPSTIGKYVHQMDGEVGSYMAIALRINGLALIGELNEQKMRELQKEIKSRYERIRRGNAYNNLYNTLNSLEKTLELYEIDRKKRAIIEDMMNNTRLYCDLLIESAEAWKDIIFWFEKNINNLDAMNDGSSAQASFDNLIETSRLVQIEVQSLGERYSKSAVEFQIIFPELVKELSGT